MRLANTWREFRAACSAVFPHGLPEEIRDSLFIRFDKDWNALPVRPQWPKIAWFWPGKGPDFSRTTLDSTLLWLSWLLGDEPLSRGAIRYIINCMSFMGLLLVGVLVLIGLVSL
jgi:hypothetical protein